MQLLIAFLSLLAASGYVLYLDHLLMSPRNLQKVLVIPIIFMVIISYYFAKKSWRIITNPYDKWLFLFGGAALTQLLVVATGGFQSPFLILIHLCMIGLSFLFSFSISVLFLLFAFVTIFIDMSFYQNIVTLLLNSPNVILLQVVSLLSIIPIAYLVSQQYHAREIVANLLKQKVTRDETIFSNLNEMIIVTDAKLRILSVNDAAIKTLQQAQAELLGRPLFDVLLLRDSTHKLVTQNTFEKQLAQGGEFTIMRSPIAKRTVTMQSQSIHNTEGTVAEISFIITYTNSNHDPLAVTLDKARARYETLMQSVKRQLAANKRSETQKELLLLEKIESDTYTLQTVHELQTKQTIEKIDIAKLCKQIVALNQEFATALTVKNNFELLNFGMKDIAPLTVKNYPVKPEQLTGPFFTVSCNAKTVEILIKKLLDITMFLATTAKHPKVTTSVSQTTDTVTVRVKGQSTLNQKEADESLWLPYYGALNHKTNLRLGSGLEGFLAKKIADTQKMKLSVNCDPKTESITFTLVLHKRPKPL